MAKASLVVVLVEGDLDSRFIYRYLRRLDYKRDIRLLKSPHGSGEQWVRQQFAVQVAACRVRAAETRLIVMLDADTLTVAQRIRQLEQMLRDAGVPPTTDADGILRLVPKRNVETWILCLNEVAVNEEEDYKRKHADWTKLIAPAVETLYGWTRPNVPMPVACVPSLKLAIPDLQRLFR